MGRKCPSFGASEPPASMVMAQRLAEIVEAWGVLMGPGRVSGTVE